VGVRGDILVRPKADTTYRTEGSTPGAPCRTRPAALRIAAPRAIPYIDGTAEWTERTVHFNRLLRDGWRLADREPHASLWERPHPTAPMTLTMMHVFEDFRRFGGPYRIDYAVSTDRGEHEIGGAPWADWDHRGRLVVAREGRLSLWHSSGVLEPIEDFNGQEPDPQPAPDWATR